MTTRRKIKCVAVFGGSGFLGEEIVNRLAAKGLDVRVGVRHPEKVRLPDNRHRTVKIEPVYADVRDESSVALAMQGCDAAVNAVGLYVERGAETFEAVHELGALNVAHQCVEHKVARLIHISGIGADSYSASRYVRARAKGELLVTDVFPETTVLRPSVLFGAQDKFINTLAKIVQHTPVVPLFGLGLTKLQAVYAGDVAMAVFRTLRKPSSKGKTYELGGPRSFTYRQIIELVLTQTSKRRLLMPLPFFVWDALAAFASLVPNSPLTRDQVTLMKRDNIVAGNALALSDLGVSATALEDILPKYAF